MPKNLTEASIETNQALGNWNGKVLELMNDKVIIAPYLASSLFNFFKPENKSQFKLIKVSNSIKMNDFLINTSVPVTLYSNMLTFRDSNKIIKLVGDLSNPQDRRIFYEYGK